ncbi:MAG: hypothetical protein WEE20_14095 [Bacteroidota bacterium]
MVFAEIRYSFEKPDDTSLTINDYEVTMEEASGHFWTNKYHQRWSEKQGAGACT